MKIELFCPLFLRGAVAVLVHLDLKVALEGVYCVFVCVCICTLKVPVCSQLSGACHQVHTLFSSLQLFWFIYLFFSKNHFIAV